MHTAPTRFERPGESGEPDPREHRPLTPLPVDSVGLACCDEASFAAIVQYMVTQEAPQLFAVVQEYGERVDGWIAAWGLAFPDHAELVSPPGLRLSVRTAHQALRWFTIGTDTRARLVWCAGSPDPAIPDHRCEPVERRAQAETPITGFA